MIDHRPLSALAGANLGWLKARHHFPVNGLPDPVHKPVKALYVWNDDQIAPGGGFPLHHHRDVEIITYVRSGAVTHRDTLGNTYELQAGDVQVMSAGTGLRHAEANRGNSPLKLFQIWLEPRQAGGRPEYATRRFPAQLPNTLSVMASGLAQHRAGDALPLRADACLLAGLLQAGRSLTYELDTGRDLYLVPATGRVLVNGVAVDEGDGVAVTQETKIEFTALRDTELVVVELA
jgi:redox-sensitive bicupin YhaK (pirin superfamily)